MMEIATELNIDIEPVPIDRFVPLPEGSDNRKIYVGQFGKINVYIADLDDIVFLIEHNYVVLGELERITKNALLQARKFDFHPEILEHLQELKSRLK